VESDRNVVDVVVAYLGDEGYSVVRAYDGEQGLRLARETAPDLIVLDLPVAKRDGRDIFREIRAEVDVPVVIVSGRTS
jgi:DNA-binding response OmpR family regulator